MTPHLLFLPGASGAASFWHPLGALLPASWRKSYLNWPGLGHDGVIPHGRSTVCEDRPVLGSSESPLWRAYDVAVLGR